MIAPLEELPLVDGIVLDPAPASIHSHVKMKSFFFFLMCKDEHYCYAFWYHGVIHTHHLKYRYIFINCGHL